MAPVITITQTQTKVDADASVVSGLTVNLPSWQNFKTTTTTKPDCNSSSTFGAASSGADEITGLSAASDKDKWVCFRVKNSSNVYGYLLYQLDFNPPVVDIIQNGSRLTANSTDIDLPTTPVWKQSSAQDTDPTCSSLASNQWSSGKTIASATHSKYYCFSITDKNGNLGYGKIKVNLAPIISIAQDQDSV